MQIKPNLEAHVDKPIVRKADFATTVKRYENIHILQYYRINFLFALIEDVIRESLLNYS